ncbi:hypothetical protein R1sor_018191 [Riccia sorocarpa]|uniref:Uncharacterized protein n=1 Tax=Riccia sorocarpa TaxID=122646 RepID=A0ABD3IC95_9MARC
MSGLLCPVYESGTRTEGEASHRWKRYPSENRGRGMMWNFFGSGHGKGEHDGQEAVLKSRLGVTSWHLVLRLRGSIVQWMWPSSNAIVLGDVFAVKADDQDVEYYLLRCTGVKQAIRDRELRCSWNKDHVFTRDEVVLYGTYFQFQKLLKEKVVFVETECRDDAIIYSHLVRAVKISLSPMQATGKRKMSPRFFIDYETHERILSAISEGEALQA